MCWPFSEKIYACIIAFSNPRCENNPSREAASIPVSKDIYNGFAVLHNIIAFFLTEEERSNVPFYIITIPLHPYYEKTSSLS